MSIDLLKEAEIKIRIAIGKEDKNTKAFVTLVFGKWRIKGFRVKTGRYGHYVDPPAIPSGGVFRPMFWADKELWQELQKLIIEKFEHEDIPVVEE